MGARVLGAPEGSKDMPPVSLSAPYGGAFEPLTAGQALAGNGRQPRTDQQYHGAMTG